MSIALYHQFQSCECHVTFDCSPLDPPMDEDEGTTNELDINWDGMIRDTTSVFMTTIPGQLVRDVCI